MINQKRTLVIIGDDPTFSIDLSAFRGIRQNTDMTFSRLKNPTIKELEDHLRRIRVAQGELPNIHIAAHMSSVGVELQDGILSPERMSELFSGANIVFLAGCESVDIGDALSAVPYVVALTEVISNEDALAFSLIFWSGIAFDHTPEDAYENASARLPAISEYTFLFHNDFLWQRREIG